MIKIQGHIVKEPYISQCLFCFLPLLVRFLPAMRISPQAGLKCKICSQKKKIW